MQEYENQKAYQRLCKLHAVDQRDEADEREQFIYDHVFCGRYTAEELARLIRRSNIRQSLKNGALADVVDSCINAGPQL